MTLPDQLDAILAELLDHILELTVHSCGYRVIQKLFERFDISQIEPIVHIVLALAANQFGNDVVQNILNAQRREHLSALIRCFEGNFYQISTHKFASNLIEKCIRNVTSSGHRGARGVTKNYTLFHSGPTQGQTLAVG
jgi:pumilio RNA-binding family